MHKRRLNEVRLQLVIEPVGPLLIKSGHESGADPTLPQMNFVRTRHPVTGDTTIYLPGSSLKGVIRSHSERILHTVFGDAPEQVCNPLDNQSHCARRIWNAEKDQRRKFSTAEQYRRLCKACRIYGHMHNGSHFVSADAFPPSAIDKLTTRHNVAIDRFSGGVAVGPFDMEVALNGRFSTTLTLTNFELWQVALLALTLRDIREGRVRMGYAKSRGLGEVRLSINYLEFAYPAQFGQSDHDFATELVGVGALAPDLVDEYGFVDRDMLPLIIPADHTDQSWGRYVMAFGEKIDLNADISDTHLATLHAKTEAVLAETVSAFAALQGG